MEFIGKLTKIGVKDITVKSTGECLKVGQFNIQGLGDHADAITFEVIDNEKGRLTQFEQFNNKVCSASLSLNIRLYNSKYYNEVRGWSVKNIT